MEAQTAQPVTPLLRPHQVDDAREELARIDKMLNAPPHIRGKITDAREMAQRKKRLKSQLDELTPQPFALAEKDAAVREYHRLADVIKSDMPSSEEMRRNPPGARELQTAWHDRHKHEVQKYKNLGLRLREGGDLPERMLHGSNAANIEMLRPLTRSHQVSMDHAQIPKARDIHIGSDPVNAVSFSDHELKVLNDLNPSLAAQIAVLPAETRAAIKSLVSETINAIKGRDAAAAYVAFPPLRRKNIDEKFTRARAAAKQNGVNSYGMGKSKLYAVLAEKQIAF